MRYLIFVLIGSTSLACGGDDGPPGDASTDDGGSVRFDAAGSDGGGGGDDGGGGGDDGGTCNGTVCGAGQLCCQVTCDGALGCSAPEGGDCPLLGCPPPPRTECGTETCDAATEVCVEGNFGGPTRIGCEDVPAGCETDRSCTCLAATYCSTGLMMCSVITDNHIFCETGLD